MNTTYGHVSNYPFDYGATDAVAQSKCDLVKAKLQRYRLLKPYPWNWVAIASIPNLKKKVTKYCAKAAATDPMAGIPEAADLPVYTPPKAATPKTPAQTYVPPATTLATSMPPAEPLPLWVFAGAGLLVVGLAGAVLYRRS